MLITTLIIALTQPADEPKPLTITQIERLAVSAKTSCPAALKAGIKGDPAAAMMKDARTPEEMLVMLDLCLLWNAAYMQGLSDERARK